MIGRYRKKPVEITAVQFRGSSTDASAIRHWMGTGEYVTSAVRTADLRPMTIKTLEGEMTAKPGDYIIRGVQGEFYPCKPDIFAATYEEIVS